jgi:hypothetical protein
VRRFDCQSPNEALVNSLEPLLWPTVAKKNHYETQGIIISKVSEEYLNKNFFAENDILCSF